MESSEINDPRAAVIREIAEETGLLDTELEQLELEYILNRLKDDEIRIQYVFFGATEQGEVIESEEGELHWIEEKEVCNLKLSTIIREMFKHYLKNRDLKELNVGVITATGGDTNKFKMQWSELKGPEIF